MNVIEFLLKNAFAYCFVSIPVFLWLFWLVWGEYKDNVYYAVGVSEHTIHLNQGENCLRDSWNSVATEAWNIHCLPSSISLVLPVPLHPAVLLLWSCVLVQVFVLSVWSCLSCPVLPAVSSCMSVCRWRGWGSSGSSTQVPQPRTCHQRGEA